MKKTKDMKLRRITNKALKRKHNTKVNRWCLDLKKQVKNTAARGESKFESRKWGSGEMPDQLDEAVIKFCRKYKLKHSMTVGVEHEKDHFVIEW